MIGALLLAGAALLLVAGAELFVENAAGAARRLGVTVLAVGLLLAGAEPEELLTAALAAAQDRPLAEVSAEMLRVRETIEPTSGTLGGHDEAYGRLVQELEDRGWLPPPVASHARERTPR